MSENKNYQLIVLGEIAEGFDDQEVKEKLATIFEKDEKQIDKLFKKSKPTIIRKNLTEGIALRYQVGLERIGVLCEIRGEETTPPKAQNKSAASTHAPPTLSFTDIDTGTPLALGEGTVRITNIRMPLGAFAVFLMKWLLASIPAFLLLGAFITLIIQVLGGLLGQ